MKALYFIIGVLVSVFTKKPVVSFPKPTGGNTVDYEIKVTGVTKIPNSQNIINLMCPDDDITLKPIDGYVTNNRAYPNAIGVFYGDNQIGWVPDKIGPYRGSMAEMIRDKWRKNKNFEILGWRKVGGMFPSSKTGIRIHVRNER